MKVLLIEDDPSIQDVYKEEFVHQKFDIETANDGEEGLAKMKTFMPDIVLLDLSMPKVTGFDVLKTMKQDPVLSKIPVYVLTNIYADVQDLIENYGAKDVLIKVNYNPGDLVAKVQKYFTK